MNEWATPAEVRALQAERFAELMRHGFEALYGGAWDRCASCSQPIRPPQEFYTHELTGQKAHVECP